ncbi:MAG: hypothetical protein IJD22_01945 [Clostridia bacterium]|nr:hypothetical protein [Clostridia bacterium]
MNNKENAGGFLCTDEERLLISRATELSVRQENSAVALSFLTPREQRLVYEAMVAGHRADRLFFWGGYYGAERRRALFLPSWIEAEKACREMLFSREREEFFVSLLSEYGMEALLSEYTHVLKLSGSGYAALEHRDYLGALMALGIKRSVLGDICVEGDSATVFCDERASAFVASELRSAGRDTVRCEIAEAGLDFCPVRQFEKICSTVASPRLDGIVRALCSVSRDEALRLVNQGMVEVNYFVMKEPDRTVSPGDIVSVRGHGKYIVDSACDATRRGRLRLLARKYV